MLTRAQALGLQEAAQLGRFKVTAVSETAGAAGVINMMESIAWKIEEVLFVGDGHAIVAAKDCPPKNKYRLLRQDGLAMVLWIHAVNCKARELFKAKNVQFRQADAEGEDVEMAAAEAVDVQTKLKSASSELAKQQKEQQALKQVRPREATNMTPARQTRQKSDGFGAFSTCVFH